MAHSKFRTRTALARTVLVRTALATSMAATGLVLPGTGVASAQATPRCNGLTVTLMGGSASEIITGTAGDDVIFAGGGNDTIRAGGGNDTICGGAGNDIIFSGNGSDTVFGEGGNDRIVAGAGRDIVAGGAGADVIGGGPGNDNLRGDAGNDRVNGGAGLDVLNGGGGNDRLVGEADPDWLNGGAGNDGLFGGGHNDRLDGGLGNDLLLGGIGWDTLSGGGGRDRIGGGPGNDTIYGGGDNDVLAGSTGNDRCHDRAGSNTVTNCNSVQVRPNQTTKIMPLGDSLTQGVLNQSSYRPFLYQSLQRSGCNVDMVGSLFGSTKGDPAGVDSNHEGHSEIRTDEIANRVTSWAQAAQPDVVLLFAGTNDRFRFYADFQTVDNLVEIVRNLRSVNPNVVVLVGDIIPLRPSDSSATWQQGGVERTNPWLPDMVQALSTNRSPVDLVPMYDNLSIGAHFVDGIHLNARGDAVVAQRWATALRPHLPSC